jgi:CheY-like chemotaxis protein
MAALALKDAGIEVIAVGNGEAAVRRMPEVLPDLVLADIFMPVRNGYEVCEFIKHDPRYANIPVLLLAGAFDPFDEQEAQRVHADGVLKKPFVPPDPLINAVKTLLAKSAGDRLMAVTVPVAAEASAESGRTAVAAPPLLEPPGEEPSYEAPEEFALPLTRDDRGANEKAVAFAPSPESRAAEIDEEVPVVTASRDPSLGEPAFWVPSEESGEAEETPSEDQDHDLTDHTWGSDGRTVPLRDDPVPIDEPAPAAELVHVDLVSGAVPQDLVVQDLIEPAVTAEPSPAVPPAVVVVPAAPGSDSASTEDRSAEDTVPLPDALVDSAALELEPLDGSSLSESPVTPMSAEALPAPEPPPVAPPLPTPLPTEVPPIVASPVTAALKEEQVPNEDKWGELLQAAQGTEPESAHHEQVAKPEPAAKSEEPVAKPEAATAPQEPAPEPTALAEAQEPAAKPDAAAHQELQAEPQEHEAEPEFAVEWPPAFVPAVSSSISDAVKSALQIVQAAHMESGAAEPAATTGPSPLASLNPGAGPLNPEAVEAAIQRVMQRMQPQIMELVTRDILRPLVEALVQQELKK